jgi:hypothetical protein
MRWSDGSHSSNPRAARRERRQKSRCILSVVRYAVAARTDSRVASREQESDSLCTELGKLIAYSPSVVLRHTLLVVSIRSRDDVWDVFLLKHVVEPCKVWLVGVSWSGEIWGEWWRPSGGI